jgi:uncharacterized protein (TIGR00297 family)
MTLADTFDVALALTAACAVLALLARALTLGGAIAGAIVGACVSVGFGLPGLAVLGTFFVVGTLATRVGWKTKKARGTAEAGEGRRDWKRVLGKGGVAAVVALAVAFRAAPQAYSSLFAGAVAAALADTLGTEFGTLWPGRPRSVPWFRSVPAGTPGAVSTWGTAATIGGGALVAAIAWRVGLLRHDSRMDQVGSVVIAGPLASVLESTAVGLGLRAPGFVRNVLTTALGAFIGSIMWVAS